METLKEIRKENINYSAENKKCNTLDLELYYFEEFIQMKEGRSKHENELLAILEKEVHALKETLEIYKKELDNNHYKKIEELK